MDFKRMIKPVLWLLAQTNSHKKGRTVTLRFLCEYAQIQKANISDELVPLLDKKVSYITHTGVFVIKDCLAFAILDWTDNDIKNAYADGAIAVVASKAIPGKPCIVVDDPMKVYAKMTQYYRSLSGADITAIVGSIGKTTTKLMCGAVYSNCERTLYEKGNFNNIRRVLRMCQRLPSRCKEVICEISEADHGTCEAASLALYPKVAIITSIDKSHIELYGSEEEIKRQVCSIAKYLDRKGVVVVNKDEFDSWQYLNSHRVLTTSMNEDADYVAENITINGKGIQFNIVDRLQQRKHQIRLNNIWGVHNVGIALQVYAAASYLGFPANKIEKGFERFRPLGIRQNAFITLTGRIVYADCFNAVAKSVKSAVMSTKNIPVKPRCQKIAVLADIEQAGTFSEETHRQIVDIINDSDFNIMIAYGPKLNKALDEVKLRDDITLIRCENRNQIVNSLSRTAKRGDLILFKSSHSWRLDKCIKRMWPVSYYWRMMKEVIPSVLFRIGVELR